MQASPACLYSLAQAFVLTEKENHLVLCSLIVETIPRHRDFHEGSSPEQQKFKKVPNFSNNQAGVAPCQQARNADIELLLVAAHLRVSP